MHVKLTTSKPSIDEWRRGATCLIWTKLSLPGVTCSMMADWWSGLIKNGTKLNWATSCSWPFYSMSVSMALILPVFETRKTNQQPSTLHINATRLFGISCRRLLHRLWTSRHHSLAGSLAGCLLFCAPLLLIQTLTLTNFHLPKRRMVFVVAAAASIFQRSPEPIHYGVTEFLGAIFFCIRNFDLKFITAMLISFPIWNFYKAL